MTAIDRRRSALDDPGMRAWVRFLQAHATVTRRLEAELHAEQGLSLAEYDALLQIAVAPERRLRMSELAASLLLSRSGVTRLVDRLETAGWVERVTCPSDARGSFAVLTEDGRGRLRDASPTHLRGVQEHFLERIPAEELDRLAVTLERLTADAPADDARCEAAMGLVEREAEPARR